MRVRGTARVDRRTKNLLHRIGAGEIAVISHTDLDAPCASALTDRRVAAVINAQRSLSGRFPHPGPGLLVRAGIPVIDNVGDYVMDRVHEGEPLELVDESIYSNGTLIGAGQFLTESVLGSQLEEAKRSVNTELARFVENTMSYVASEQTLLLEPSAVPALRTQITGRHCLIVVRGPGANQDLRAISSYIAGMHPVLIGVDGGADVLLQEGYRPDIIIGDMDSVSDDALGSGAEIIVHAYPDGAAPGLRRVQDLGLRAVVLASTGTSEDVAMLLAYEKDADLIAAVGTHFSLSEFLEKSRGGMSSTFLVRLKVGSLLVDAKGIGRLYPTAQSPRLFIYLAAVAGLIILVLLTVAPAIRATLDLWILRLATFFRSFHL
jgi:uncharacterized membrane-anchored protein